MTEKSWDASIWVRENWFYPVAVATVAFDLAIVQFAGWDAPRANELALLFDFAIQTPFLYWLCFRTRGPKAVLGAIAMSCLAIWALGHIIPAGHQAVLNEIAWVRPLGLAVLVLFEIKILVLVWKSVFSGGAVREDIARQLDEDGTPQWVSRLLIAEAKLWKKAWSLIRRVFGLKR